jgi:hypothetical protein
MAFVVETGVGLSNSTAYAAVATVDSYHADRGNTKWTGSSTLKEQCIIRASDYIDKRFGKRFRGRRMLKEQALEWPRLSAMDDSGFLYNGVDAVPRKLVAAVSEYALRALLLGELAPDAPVPVPGMNNASGSSTRTSVVSGQLKSQEIAGAIKREFFTSGEMLDFAASNRATVSDLVNTFVIPEYPAADLLMQELIRSGTSKEIVRG